MKLSEYVDLTRGTKRQLSVELVAKRRGVAPSTVYRWMNGTAKISAEDALAIEQMTDGAVPVESWPQKRGGSDPDTAPAGGEAEESAA